jgi:hypothetical protein
MTLSILVHYDDAGAQERARVGYPCALDVAPEPAGVLRRDRPGGWFLAAWAVDPRVRNCPGVRPTFRQSTVLCESVVKSKAPGRQQVPRNRWVWWPQRQERRSKRRLEPGTDCVGESVGILLQETGIVAAEQAQNRFWGPAFVFRR